MAKRVVKKQIQPVDWDNLDDDLRFTFQNYRDDEEQFIREATEVVKTHLNDMMVAYQEQILKEITDGFRGEAINIIMRSRRDTVIEEEDEDDEW